MEKRRVGQGRQGSSALSFSLSPPPPPFGNLPPIPIAHTHLAEHVGGLEEKGNGAGCGGVSVRGRERERPQEIERSPPPKKQRSLFLITTPTHLAVRGLGLAGAGHQGGRTG